MKGVNNNNMVDYKSIKDVPGLHFVPKEGQESNVKFSGNTNSNPDIAGVVQGTAQTVVVDDLGFLWRTASDNLNLVRTARVVDLSLSDKLSSITKKLRKLTGLKDTTKAIYIVKHNDKLLDDNGRDIDMAHVQDALWLTASGIASSSFAKIALRKVLDIRPKNWTGFVNETDNLELIRLLISDDVEVLTQ